MDCKATAYNLARFKVEQNKDNEQYYANWQFRREYTDECMVPKAAACYDIIRSPVEDLIRNRFFYYHAATANQWQANYASPMLEPSTSGDPTVLKVLALGCGPGTELLAAAWACLEVGGLRIVELTGVDKYPWPTDLFGKRMDMAQADSAAGFYWTVFKATSADFVDYCWTSGRKFDLIISCYAGARYNIGLLGGRVPQLLHKFGRVFVIDNNSYELQDGLGSFGFYKMCERNDGKLVFFAYDKLTNF